MLLVYVCIWKPFTSGKCRTSFGNRKFKGSCLIWIGMLFPFQWSKPNSGINWICWVDWRNFGVGLLEVPNNCATLQLDGGKLQRFYNNCETWRIWVHLNELWTLDPTFNSFICVSHAFWTRFFFSKDARSCGNWKVVLHWRATRANVKVY